MGKGKEQNTSNCVLHYYGCRVELLFLVSLAASPIKTAHSGRSVVGCTANICGEYLMEPYFVSTTAAYLPPRGNPAVQTTRPAPAATALLRHP